MTREGYDVADSQWSFYYVITLVENIEHVEMSAFLFGGSPDRRSGVVISDIDIEIASPSARNDREDIAN